MIRFQMSYYPEAPYKKGVEQKKTELLIDTQANKIRQDVDLDEEGQ